jgi:hypothetical protein
VVATTLFFSLLLLTTGRRLKICFHLLSQKHGPKTWSMSSFPYCVAHESFLVTLFINHVLDTDWIAAAFSVAHQRRSYPIHQAS